jgi:hypothetical protein
LQVARRGGARLRGSEAGSWYEIRIRTGLVRGLRRRVAGSPVGAIAVMPLAAPAAGLLGLAAVAAALALGLDRLGRGPLQRDPDVGRVQLVHRRPAALAGLVAPLLQPPGRDYPDPLLADSATFSARPRQAVTAMNRVSPSCQPPSPLNRSVEAIRKFATAAPDGVNRSSGSATRLPPS